MVRVADLGGGNLAAGAQLRTITTAPLNRVKELRFYTGIASAVPVFNFAKGSWRAMFVTIGTLSLGFHTMRRFSPLSFCTIVLALAAASPGLCAIQHNSAQNLGSDPSVASLKDRSAKSRALYLTLINDMRQSGRTHAALAHLDAFDKMYPRGTDAAVMRGNCLVDIRSFEEARTVYRKLLKSNVAAAAYAGLGRIEGLNGRWPEAVTEFSEAVSRAPTEPNYLNDYGYALLRQGNAQQALFQVRQASELAPSDARVRNNLILVLSASGDTAGANVLLNSIVDQDERADVRTAMLAQSAPLAAPARPTGP